MYYKIVQARQMQYMHHKLKENICVKARHTFERMVYFTVQKKKSMGIECEYVLCFDPQSC